MTARMRTCKLASISLHTNVHAGHRAPIERLLQAFSPKYSTVKYRKVDMMVFRNRENRFKNKTQLTHTHSLAYPLTPLTYSLTQSFIHSLAQSPHHPLAYKHTDTHTHTHMYTHMLSSTHLHFARLVLLLVKKSFVLVPRGGGQQQRLRQQSE